MSFTGTQIGYYPFDCFIYVSTQIPMAEAYINLFHLLILLPVQLGKRYFGVLSALKQTSILLF